MFFVHTFCQSFWARGSQALVVNTACCVPKFGSLFPDLCFWLLRLIGLGLGEWGESGSWRLEG